MAYCPEAWTCAGASHIVVCVVLHIDQKEAIRRGCRIGERLLNERASTRLHLFAQVRKLRRVSRVFEHDHVLGVQMVRDKKLVGETNSRLARYSSTKIGECMC